jgi:cytochrome c oxidase subunit IV
MKHQASAKQQRFGIGTKTIGILAVMTAVEFWAAVGWPRSVMWAALVVLAVGKAGLIGWYFMHVKQLWREEEH